MTGCTRARRHARQHGQAMVEVAVAAAVLLPLLLLVPVLAKYVHTRQTVQQASRAAAWEATVSPELALPQLEVTRARLVDRHFGTARAAIQTTASAAAADAAVDNVMFNSWSGQPLVRRGDVALQAYGDRAAPGALSATASLVAALPLGWDTPNPRGLVTANLEVRPRNLVDADGRPARLLAPFDTIDLAFRAESTLLADAWNAAGPHGHARAVRNQVIPLVPTARLTTCERVPDVIDGVPLPNLCPLLKFHELLGTRVAGVSLEDIPIVGIPLRLEPGLIEPDVVPVDRLRAEP